MPLPIHCKPIPLAALAPIAWHAFAHQISSTDRRRLQGRAERQPAIQSSHPGAPFYPTNDARPPVPTSHAHQHAATHEHDNQGLASNPWADAEQPAGKTRHDTTLVVSREKQPTQVDRNPCVDRSAIHCTHNVGESALIAANHSFTGSPQMQPDFATEAFR